MYAGNFWVITGKFPVYTENISVYTETFSVYDLLLPELDSVRKPISAKNILSFNTNSTNDNFAFKSGGKLPLNTLIFIKIYLRK